MAMIADAFQRARWKNPLRKPFRFFTTVREELTVTTEFWKDRTPQERLEYLEFMRGVLFGEDAVNAPMVRCYNKRKWTEAEPAADKTIYF